MDLCVSGEHIRPVRDGHLIQFMGDQPSGSSQSIRCLLAKNRMQIYLRLKCEKHDQGRRYKGQIHKKPEEDFGE
jgi:hypothetical protein